MDAINENTTYIVTVTFKDENGVGIQPASGSYWIKDLLSNTTIKAATDFTPGASAYTITVASTDNAIVDATQSFEKRALFVTWNYGSGGTKNGEDMYVYAVRNLLKTI
jgi:hypothetical protein